MSRLPVVVLTIAASIAVSDIGTAANLGYGWKAGETYTYSVKITAALPDYNEVIHGTAAFSIRTLQAGLASIDWRISVQNQMQTRDGRWILSDDPSRLARWGVGGAWDGSEGQIDSGGRPLKQPSGVPIFLCGDLRQLILAELPAPDQAAWSTDREVIVAPERAAGRGGASGLKASEHIEDKLLNPQGGLLEITRTYDLKSDEKVDGAPAVEINGSGSTLFDPTVGIARSINLKLTLSESIAGAGLDQVPVAINCSLLTGSGGNPSVAPTMSTFSPDSVHHLNSTLSLAPPPPGKYLSDRARAQLIADLASADHSQRLNAADRLAEAPADNHRAEVITALTPLLSDSDVLIRQTASRAVGVWGTADVVPALIKLLEDSDFSVRWSAMDALGTLRDPVAAPALARRLSGPDRFKASHALQEIGAAAAPAVIPLLQNNDWMTRVEVCKILKAIGDQKIISSLEPVTSDFVGAVATAAKEAVLAIRARG